MDSEHNLLFGVMALQADLIDVHQFAACCKSWAANQETPLADLMIGRGWILPDDKTHLDYLVERKLHSRRRADPAGMANHDGEMPRAQGGEGLGAAVSPANDLTQAEDSHSASTDSSVLADHRRYSLTSLHATGGMGRVWLARDRYLGREIALKELRPEHAGNAAIRARFLREARINGQLEHPGIVPIYELDERPGDAQPFYTMRLIKGRTLSEKAREYHRHLAADADVSLEFLDLLKAFVATCNTLAYAHSCGVVHRDLKGQNVILGDFGEVVVLDWGLAKVVGQSECHASTSPDAALASREGSGELELTVHGQAIGTPAYMAPEQAAGSLDLIDHRTDIYGLGTILYEILTGQPPYTGSDARETVKRVQREAVKPPRLLCAVAPAALEEICLRALAKSPAERYSSAGERAREVQHWQETERKLAEAALRASESLDHSLVETIPINVWRKDAEGRFTFGNNGFCDTTKVRVEELVGKDDFDLFPRELAEKYRCDDRRVLDSGETIDTTEEHVTSQGERLRVRVIKLPVRDGQGRIVGTQGIFWDLDRWNRSEALAARTDAGTNQGVSDPQTASS
jgi:PAS domain S-box-containing protein